MSQVTDKAAAFLPPERVVKPRVAKYKTLPVVAVSLTEAISEDGSYVTFDELVELLPEMPSTLFACRGAASLVAKLDEHFAPLFPDTWQWRIASHEREIYMPGQVRRAVRVSTVVHYFGWTGRGSAFHRIIDPVTMYNRPYDPDDLLGWAVALRDFCADNGLQVRPTTGGIAAQFLTDKRFYPDARRKVPAATNATVREQLPGNHYHLNVEPSPENDLRAVYLDQHSAHHYHAAHTDLPDANTLYAYGRFQDLDRICFPAPWPNFYGLYCLDLEGDPDVPFDWLGKRREKVFVYSNELQHILDMGYRVTGVRAAWGSLHKDTGLARYSAFATEQLEQYSNPAWLKPILLAAYGVLAVPPTENEAIFRLAKSGTPAKLLSVKLQGVRVTGRKLEPRTANVLHRGMIEVATRSESVGLAQWLDAAGQTVLSIYADAVIVQQDDDLPLPPLPEPWRHKDNLNHLQFIHSQAFQSDSMTKLPGVSGTDRKRYRQMSPGVAPHKRKYEALTGRPVKRKVTDGGKRRTEHLQRRAAWRSFPERQG